MKSWYCSFNKIQLLFIHYMSPYTIVNIPAQLESHYFPPVHGKKMQSEGLDRKA